MYMYMMCACTTYINECSQVHNEETLTCNPLPNNELFLMSRVESIIQQVSELMADILREREGEEGGRGEGGKEGGEREGRGREGGRGEGGKEGGEREGGRMRVIN